MEENQKSYRSIMKATSLFGGVQVFNIIISIIRAKIIAVLLGPAGMGIAGLLTSSTGLIGSLTNFGLGTSAVKDIASAYNSTDEKRISKIVAVFRKLVWITGLLGAIITLTLSPWLSQLTFGNKKYTLAFVWLSITLLFNQLTSGQDVLLQGMRKLSYLAKANVMGSASGLLVSIPIYYFMGVDGIVPATILSSFFLMIIAWYFARKIEIVKISVTTQQTYNEGVNMLKMGFILSISGLISTGVAYILRIFISNVGGVAQVGLYTAGFSIIGTYVGLVFSAMTTDYYPRLSGIAHDNKQALSMINQQAEIAVLILAPILTVFMLFVNLLILLLYSNKFVAINGMIHWAALGMYFKAASWSIGFIFLAKRETKVFFWSELSANIYMLLFNILFYYWKGLDGLGISFLLSYFIVLIQVFFIAKLRYNFTFSKDFLRIFFVQIVIGILCFLCVKIGNQTISYILGSLLFLISFSYSIKELNCRIDIRSLIANLISTKK